MEHGVELLLDVQLLPGGGSMVSLELHEHLGLGLLGNGDGGLAEDVLAGLEDADYAGKVGELSCKRRERKRSE